MSKLLKFNAMVLYLVLFLNLLNLLGLAEASQSNEIVVIDALSRIVVLDKTPNRIVSLAPSITETIFILNNQHRLVGVDSISYNTKHLGIADYVHKNNISDVGGYWWSLIKVEAILALNPDLVLADKGAHTPLLNVFEEHGLKVIYLNGGSAETLEDVFNDIKLVGKILGVSNFAEQVVSSIEEKIVEYRGVIADKYRSVNYMFIVYLNGGIWVAGRSTFINDILGKLGLTNTIDKEGWVVLSVEDIAKLKPDLTLVATMGDVESTKKLVETYGLDKFTKFLYVLNPDETDYFVRPGPLVNNTPLIVNKVLEIAGFWKPPVVSQPTYTWVIILTILLVYVYVKSRLK